MKELKPITRKALKLKDVRESKTFEAGIEDCKLGYLANHNGSEAYLRGYSHQYEVEQELNAKDGEVGC